MEDLSAVFLLQKLLDDALEAGCSDVHIVSTKAEHFVQWRRAGVLVPYLRGEGDGFAVIRRIKALAKLDVAEVRMPQDGAFQWESESKRCDIRVAAVPTVQGEMMVMRLFPQARTPLDFTSIGMTMDQARVISSVLQSDAGMVLVSGPTGAGKTTTLYAMMLQLSRWGRKVVSIEDPVEMPLRECQQVEVRERTGITFDVGLRALLRQDPDAIMIGEIRDEPTARVAARAALTGHLVLSTAHARDFPGLVARLTELGLTRATVAEVLSTVVVQRLESNHAKGADGRIERTPSFAVLQIGAQTRQWLASDCSWTELRHRIGSVHLRTGELQTL